MISELVVALLLLISVLFFIDTKRKKNLPPGPKGLPLIGNVHQIDKLSHLTFTKWANEFGSMYSVNILSTRMVILSDLKLIKELFSNEATFTGRPHTGALDLFEGGVRHGIVFTDGEDWEQLRKFTLRQLRDFGFGKNSMETGIMEEVNELLDWFRSHSGKPFSDLESKFTLAVVNSLWAIISGERYKHDDPKLIRLTKSLHEATGGVTANGNVLMLAPWIRHIIPEWSGFNKYRKIVNEFCGFFVDSVEKHKRDYDDSFARDFIDVFLKQIKETKDTKSTFYGEFGERQLVGTIGDLFVAGSDTTSITLTFAVLYLSKFPEVQKKLQKEIESITGNTRPCSLVDRPSMPYAEATISEVLRFSSITPTGGPHRALVDKEFKGYLIPKDTIVFANTYSIHHNPVIWGDPENFRPERFLSPDGKTFKKHEALVPFLVGKRQCLGESLARDTLFLFLTNTYQNFTTKFPKNYYEPDMEPVQGLVLSPKPFEVIFEKVL